jgi:hypothetical protein
MGLLSRAVIFAMFALSPLYLFNTFVLPALDDLAHVYSNLDQTAHNVIADKPPVPAVR